MALFSSLFSLYGIGTLEKQISISFLVYSLLVPAVMAIAFGTFLYLKTKKLSSFYLFLLCYIFGIYSILDLGTWAPNAEIVMFTWSILRIFSLGSFVFSYWFLYVFLREQDLPIWQKIFTSLALLTTIIPTALSTNMSIYIAPTGIAIENQGVFNLLSTCQFFFILVVIIFSIIEYFKAGDAVRKRRVILAGSGVTIFLFVYFLVMVVIGYVISINLWGLGANNYIYNIDSYASFGMPIFLAFLGYLIAKYQAFDVKLIKSIVYMVILMVLLFIGLFFA